MTTKFAVLLGVAMAAMLAPALAQETRSYVDDAGIEVEVPVDPQRIVSMHDSSLTTPLLELGIMPVGSFSRVDGAGNAFMRGTATLSGVSFENSPIRPIGGMEADIEAIAALDPDLIIMSPFTTTPREQLESIAPTVLVEDNMRGELATFEDLAELTNRQGQLQLLKDRYANQIEQLKQVIGDRELSASVFLVHSGEVQVWHTYGVIGKVLRDAGFAFPEALNRIAGDDRDRLSAESIPELDGDLIFLTYLADSGVQQVKDDLEIMLPGYCDFLQACRNDQVVYLPREDAVARSYTAAGMMAAAVGAVISTGIVQSGE